jgi:hypothetical protein
MTYHDLCDHPHTIDFDNPQHLREILRLDKHTRIEGLCSEITFLEDVVQGNLDPVTGDFWFVSAKGQTGYDLIRIVPDPKKPFNDLDYRLLDGFTRAGHARSISIVWFDEANRQFRKFAHVRDRRYHDLQGLGELVALHAPEDIAPIEDRNTERIGKACDFLEQRGLLRDAAIKRIFANCCIGGAVWDIDAFTRTDSGKVVALEVKQKYPTRAKSFGLNDGQQRLFGFLTGIGMPVIHVVLRKPLEDINAHAIDLLTQDKWRSQTKWYVARFMPENLKAAVAPAPAYTHIYGQADMNYDHFPLDKFAELKTLGERGVDVKGKLLAGITA